MDVQENTIKLQCGYYISVASIRCAFDALRGLDLDTLTNEGQSTLNEIEIALSTAQNVLDNVLSEIRELDDNIDSQDEKGIDDMACKVEQMIEDGLYKKKIPSQPATDAIANMFPPESLKIGETNMVEFAGKVVLGGK